MHVNTVKAVNRESFLGNEGINVEQRRFFITNKIKVIYGIYEDCSLQEIFTLC